MLNVAIIGAGNIGRVRAQALQRSGNSRLLLVSDIDQDRAFSLAAETGSETAIDWRTAVNEPGVDAIIICTPTKFHAPIAIAALRAGKHVLCEKPLARSVAEAAEIVSAAEGQRCVLKTGFNYRYMNHVAKAKELLDSGVLGQTYFLRCRFGHGGRPGYEKEWCTDQEISGGGVLLEQGIHILDLVRYLLGEPARITASNVCFFWNFPDVEDNSFVEIQTDMKQVAQIHISWTQWINVLSLEIFGHDGYIQLSGRDGHYGPQRLIWGKRQVNHGRPAEQTFEFPSGNTSWDAEWIDFVEAIRSGTQPMGDMNDSLRALQLVEGAYESGRRHGWAEVVPLTTVTGSSK